MRFPLLVIGVLVPFLAACGPADREAAPDADDGPSAWLISGERSFPLELHEETVRIQDDIVRIVRGLWDELGATGSVEFRLRRTLELDLGEKTTEVPGGEAEIMTRTKAGITLSSTPYRLFKDRNRASGIEEAVEEPTGPELRSGPEIGWAEIEEDIRTLVFSERILETMFLPDREDDRPR